MCSTSAQFPEEREGGIVQQPVSQFPSHGRRRVTAELDISDSPRYSAASIPAGPLSQDMLSLGGSFIGSWA